MTVSAEKSQTLRLVPPYQSDVMTAEDFLAASLGPTYQWLPPTEYEELDVRKALWLHAWKQAGGTQAECAITLAQLMQESANGTGYDHTKDDRTDGARNFSNLNLNEDMLDNFGHMKELFQGDKAELNTDAHIPTIALSALFVLRNMGADRYLFFVRGGRSAYDQPNEDAHRFAQSIKRVANAILETEEHFVDTVRLAHQIQHI